MIYYAILTKKWIHVSIDSIKENRYLNMHFLKYSNLNNSYRQKNDLLL